ncbi:hypothetical protein M413DRAFT_442010 [Hebeloma cylindrosporum]|uniref:Uncharacterized protein n=1 Tax=Hebeloma cylindrosporum TaxID=76867 RepID=A0A0C3CMI7_HEBCY|nr:hypothetical protein M413DRAFT_442010 [Hebeloma cylindrosporum h7]
MIQQPTCIGLRVRTPADAHVIFHAVHQGILRMVARRLDTEERRAISPGCVYVWEERGASAETNGVLGIERWTDSMKWGGSRVKDEFLFYYEERKSHADLEFMTSGSESSSRHAVYRPRLTKQTYSVYVNTPKGRRKWHLIAYVVPETVERLATINDHPELASLHVPRGMYTAARLSKTRRKDSTSTFLSGDTISSSSSGLADSQPFTVPIRELDDTQGLAPLVYLNSCAPPRRHVMDEMALNSFLGFP